MASRRYNSCLVLPFLPLLVFALKSRQEGAYLDMAVEAPAPDSSIWEEHAGQFCDIQNGAQGRVEHSDTTLDLCKTACSQDITCSAIDFDGSSCRTYSDCPSSSRSAWSGFAVHMKPDGAPDPSLAEAEVEEKVSTGHGTAYNSGDSDTSGDPHVTTLAGEKYDILRSGSYVALVIPRGSKDALYQIQLLVVQRGEECAGSLFTEAVTIRGSLLENIDQIAVKANKEFTIKMDGLVRAHTSGMLWTIAHIQVPPVGWPANQQAFNTTIQAHRSPAGRRSYTLSLGGVTTHIEAVGKRGFYFLNMATTGVSKVKLPIGGFLGFDEHLEETRSLCAKKRNGPVSERSTLLAASESVPDTNENFITIS